MRSIQERTNGKEAYMNGGGEALEQCLDREELDYPVWLQM